MRHHYDGIDGTNANTSREQPTENKYGTTESAGEPQPGEQSAQAHLNAMIPEWNPDSIFYWQKKIMAWAESKGWNQGLTERSFGDWCTLLHTEISEAYEDHRDNRGFAEVYYEVYDGNKVLQFKTDQNSIFNPQEFIERGFTVKPCGIPIEMADLAIRLFHLAEYFDFDLADVITQKMAYNEKRPYRHGNKKL